MRHLLFAVLTLLLLQPNTLLAATLSLSPATGVYSTGATFTVRVVVDTKGAAINAADGTLSFNAKELQVVSVSRASSIFNLWTTEPTFSNSAGTINFSGGSPTGYTGSSGTVFTVTFRTLGAGSPRVTMTSGSVLAADGRGTNVLSTMGSGAYTVSASESAPAPEVIIEFVPPANTPAAPKITSSTHPDQTSWYKEKTARLAWTVPAGVTAVRTLLDQNPSAIPTKVYDTPISDITLTDLEEGVSYFHIQFKNEDGWGKITHYRLAVDTSAPQNFSVALAPESNLAHPSQVLISSTSDTTAPLVRYVVQINTEAPFTLENITDGKLPLTNLSPGEQVVTITGYDAAGNETKTTLTFTIEAFDAPVFADIPPVISSGVVPVFMGTTRANATVTATLVATGQQPITLSALADQTGQFRIIPQGILNDGVYELTAVATDEFGAQSVTTNSVRFVVQPSGLVRVGSYLVGVLSVLVPLFAMIVVTLLGAGLLWRRLRFLLRGVRKEGKETIAVIERDFAEIEQLLQAKEAELIASRKTKKLTTTEADLIAAIRLMAKKSRTEIEKEATDVTNLTS